MTKNVMVFIWVSNHVTSGPCTLPAPSAAPDDPHGSVADPDTRFGGVGVVAAHPAPLEDLRRGYPAHLTSCPGTRALRLESGSGDHRTDQEIFGGVYGTRTRRYPHPPDPVLGWFSRIFPRR